MPPNHQKLQEVLVDTLEVDESAVKASVVDSRPLPALPTLSGNPEETPNPSWHSRRDSRPLSVLWEGFLTPPVTPGGPPDLSRPF